MISIVKQMTFFYMCTYMSSEFKISERPNNNIKKVLQKNKNRKEKSSIYKELRKKQIKSKL